MKKVVNDYKNCSQNLFQYFNCESDYLVRLALDHRWSVIQDESISILQYRSGSGRPIQAVIAKKDGEPLIFPREDYTMVIAIDCVKIAFILDNQMQQY